MQLSGPALVPQLMGTFPEHIRCYKRDLYTHIYIYLYMCMCIFPLSESLSVEQSGISGDSAPNMWERALCVRCRGLFCDLVRRVLH